MRNLDLLELGVMGTVRKQDLISQVVAAGCDPPSDDLLKRLAREGLLQRPKQRHPGRQRGSISEYPAKAVAQAIGVLRLHAEVHRFDNLRFWTFWEGLWVESRILRQTLSHWMKATIPSLPRNKDPFELAEKLAFDVPGEEIAERLRIKNPDDAQSTLFAILLGSMGGDPGWDFEPLQVTTREELDVAPSELAGRILKLEGLTQPVGQFGPLVEKIPQPSDLLRQLAETGHGNPGWWARAMQEIPITDLRAARDTARILSEIPESADLLAKFDPSANMPSEFVNFLRGPGGRRADAIRHRVILIGVGMVHNKLQQQEIVVESLNAFENLAQKKRAFIARN